MSEAQTYQEIRRYWKKRIKTEQRLMSRLKDTLVKRLAIYPNDDFSFLKSRILDCQIEISRLTLNLNKFKAGKTVPLAEQVEETSSLTVFTFAVCVGILIFMVIYSISISWLYTLCI